MFAACWFEGRAMTLDEAIEYGLQVVRAVTKPTVVVGLEARPADRLSDIGRLV
jgi:hypothetical protein